jgi:hypothetical protein
MVRRSRTVTFECIHQLQDDIDIIQGNLHHQSSFQPRWICWSPREGNRLNYGHIRGHSGL